jgi:hypothetical protein
MSEFIEIELQLAAVTLAEELSYTRAAKKLNITQPVLRKQISGLERQLELHVFRPNQRRVEVTEEGRIFLSTCHTFLIQIGKLQNSEKRCERIVPSCATKTMCCKRIFVYLGGVKRAGIGKAKVLQFLSLLPCDEPQIFQQGNHGCPILKAPDTH